MRRQVKFANDSACPICGFTDTSNNTAFPSRCGSGGPTAAERLLLARELVGLIARDSVSRETVRRRLAENPLKPWRKKHVVHPQVDGEYVGAWRMSSISMPKPPIPSTR